MSSAGFATNPVNLHQLLQACESGKIQLPDFQRSWVWDEQRIISLIDSIANGFPVGAIMTLQTGGDVNFKPRLVEGAPESASYAKPEHLLLDGQQRLTSLYQATLRNQVVETVTPGKKKVKRWFYFDIRKAVSNDPSIREEAIVGVAADRKSPPGPGKGNQLDLSTRELEYEHLMFPLPQVFEPLTWTIGYYGNLANRVDGAERQSLFEIFNTQILEPLKKYQVPVIALDNGTSKEAVCVVFEKVNTGGKALDAFELITATYAADGYELRKDWYGDGFEPGYLQRFRTFAAPPGHFGVLSSVANTDLLHVITLFHTQDKHREAKSVGKTGNELPQITGNRGAMLNLPLSAYKHYRERAAAGFEEAAKFLNSLHIYRAFDLPYQSQVVPLAAIFATLGKSAHFAANKAKLEQWFWCGVFGELYGSATETRVSLDFQQIPGWLDGGDLPKTIQDAVFQTSRLFSMRMRLSAAYKGVNALLMKEQARDFCSDQLFQLATFFNENVDIHHIFPQAWCKSNQKDPKMYDSIINKTPLSSYSNQMIGGDAPSKYLEKIETGWKGYPGTTVESLDSILRSHLIDPTLLRSDRFEEFFQTRHKALVRTIESAMHKPAAKDIEFEEGVDVSDEDLILLESGQL